MVTPDGSVYYWNEFDYDEMRNKLRGRHFSDYGDMNYFYELKLRT